MSLPMPQPSETEDGPKKSASAMEHVSGARELLQSLSHRIGEHPELAEAIVKLETALSILTVKTAGML
jgi:hypothetical protein